MDLDLIHSIITLKTIPFSNARTHPSTVGHSWRHNFKIFHTSMTAIRARVRPVPVSIEPSRESPILHEMI